MRRVRPTAGTVTVDSRHTLESEAQGGVSLCGISFVTPADNAAGWFRASARAGSSWDTPDRDEARRIACDGISSCPCGDGAP
jgi:hypothetical protein